MLTVKLTRYVYVTGFLLFALFSSFSEAVPAQIPKKVTTIEISTGEWPPFLSESLVQQGVVAHLIRDIFAQINIHVNFTFLPWSRAYYDTANGKYAATAVWMFTPQRAVDYLYSDSVLNEQFVFFYNTARPFKWHNINDLKGLLLGGGLGYSYGSEFDSALKNGLFEMTRVNATEQNFRLLGAGRIDAFAEEQSVGYYTLNNHLPELVSTITHHPTPLLINKSFLMLPRNNENSEQLLKTFNEQLAQFKQSGRYQEYFERLKQGHYQLPKHAPKQLKN